MAQNKAIKVGDHRGCGRIWLQGKWLLAWFGECRHFAVSYSADRIVISHSTPAEGRKTTTNARGAIIDLVSAGVRESIPTPSASVTITPKRITITPIG